MSLWQSGTRGEQRDSVVLRRSCNPLATRRQTSNQLSSNDQNWERGFGGGDDAP